MHLTHEKIKTILQSSVFGLDLESIQAIGRLLSIDIELYHKTPALVVYKLTNNENVAYLECENGHSCAMGFAPKVKDALTGFTVWRDCETLTHALRLYRSLYCLHGYHQSINPALATPNYTPQEYQSLALMVNELVEEGTLEKRSLTLK